MKYIKWETVEKKWMKDPEFRRIAKKLEPEYQLARSLIAARIKRKMSQTTIAKKAGTNQASISRLESGSSKPSLSLLRKVASALNARLMVRFET